MNRFLILPGCDETNRGDQALIWQTKHFAEEAGFYGEYYMLASEEKCIQSKKENISSSDYILRHPGDSSKKSNNIRYGISLKVKWGIKSLAELCCCLPLLNSVTRKIWQMFLSPEQKRSLSIFEGATAAFVKGGGFLHTSHSIIDSYKIFFFLYHIKLAQASKIPVYVFPNSIGPLDAPFTRNMAAKVLGKCKMVMCRETISQNYLFNYCKVDSLLVPDLGFHLPKDSSIDVDNEFMKCGIEAGAKRKIAITMRPYRFPGKENSDALYENYKTSLVDLIVYLSRKGYYPILVEHVYSELEHEQDIFCINEVSAQLPEDTIYGVFSNRELDCRQLKAIYASCDFTIGTRFHSVIFSLSELVPSIAIAYGGNKGTGIMQDIGLSDYVCLIDEVSGTKLIELFESLINNEMELKEKLKAIKSDYQKRFENMASVLMEK